MIIDPPPAPEGGSSLRATDLKNQPCIIRGSELGTWPAKPAEYDGEGNVVKKAQKESEYVECEVWTLDRAGLLDHHEGVRISWWKAVDQLKGNLGALVACRPMQVDPNNNAISLEPLTGAARDVAQDVAANLIDNGPANAAPPAYESGEEPFTPGEDF